MNLKELRKSLELSQQAAGERLGVTKQRWGQMEQQWPNLAAHNLIDISTKFDVAIKIDSIDVIIVKKEFGLTNVDTTVMGFFKRKKPEETNLRMLLSIFGIRSLNAWQSVSFVKNQPEYLENLEMLLSCKIEITQKDDVCFLKWLPAHLQPLSMY